ncbi:MAG: topoisomerase DNA-binding C4 zinc finger domain-containing protein, partial [Thermoleophilia bacterium]|nr:topoisomerase DNA-binding C4 zinc finger domain-containing protein [Thermoleophilia bacterium]
KTSKKRFVGCEGYPECDQTYPLPQRGDVIGTDEVCPHCGSPKVKILGGRRPWVLCLDPDCPSKAAYREKAEGKRTAGKAVAALSKGAGARGSAARGTAEATVTEEAMQETEKEPVPQ